jgi:hypothetical protein
VDDVASYDEDSGYDEEWDWELSDELEVTYREAVAQLRILIQGRADVRIEWREGARGPQRDGDARIVFLAGSAERRVRLRSASQLDSFMRIISTATLLADRHALWYPAKQTITARLIGDYDQLHIAVLRTFRPKLGGRTFDRDSPLGGEVISALEHRGAFHAEEPTNAPGSQSRAIGIRYASPDLRLLYGPYGQDIPSVAIELTGFDVPDAAAAERTLLEYGISYLFELARGTGTSLRLWRQEYRLGSQRPIALSGKARFPQRHYDEDPAELYAAGNSADRDPIERYLKYYQVLEFYMTKAADSIAKLQGLTINKATSPLLRPPPDNQLNREQNKLDCVIYLALTLSQVISLLGDKDLFATLSNSQIIQDVQALTANSTGQPTAAYDYRLEISTRVYGIRNKIVHMKEGGGNRSQNLLTPYSREARDLATDIRLVRFLAEHTMRYWAQSLH